MEIFRKLEAALKNVPDAVTDSGELKKWIVASKAQNGDTALLAALLADADIKATFFKEIAGCLIFDRDEFLRYLEEKSWLKDSYTRYRQKVGLTIGGLFLAQRNEVELVWPYKDCVLEGGQTSEEQKRDEIFFNQTLAQDEISLLLEPKVITAAKRYTVKGSAPLDTFQRRLDGTIVDNLIIKGNNLLALHSLKKEFAGKVKLIYINPPYNTGSDSFKYNDSFRRSAWLTFMKNRLEAAKTLLRNDGVVCVQSSFHQFAYLKLLLDDVFCKSLCTFNIQVRHPDRILTGDKEYNDVIEYTLIYAKDENTKMPKQEEQKTNEEYIFKVVETGAPEIVKFGDKDIQVFTPDKYMVKEEPAKSSLFKKISVRGSIREKNSSGRLYVKYIEPIATNYPPETIFKVMDMGDDSHGFRYFYTPSQKQKNGGYYQGKPTSSEITVKPYPNFYNYEKEYNNVAKEGEVPFRNGKKPEDYICFLVKIFSSPGDIVLDYHLGSGTTAAVAHKMGRQYIGVEQMDYIETVAVARLQKVIGRKIRKPGDLIDSMEFDEGGVSKAVGWHGGGEFVYLEMKKFNEVFVERIRDAKDTAALLVIWTEMKARSFLDYNTDMKAREAAMEEFKAMELAEQKRELCGLLDKNMLYVPVSALKDGDYACTDEEKRVTREFYRGAEREKCEEETSMLPADSARS